LLNIEVSPAELAARAPIAAPPASPGFGRELFSVFRNAAASPEAGGGVFPLPGAYS
jgi:hypothetical protein